jgi:hypothetical protein
LVLRALQASKEAGRETSLEELARSGFLRAWAVCSKRCDESTLRWAYHQMAYSSDEALERACCRFLCDLVSRVSSVSSAFSARVDGFCVFIRFCILFLE